MQRTVGALLAGLALAGCPPKKPPVALDAPPDVVIRPTVARAWADVELGLYPSLAAGTVSIAELQALHDVARWTPSRQKWGPLSVLQYEDTDRPTTAIGAVAGWALGDGDVVEAVVLRDFTDAPEAPSYTDLLLGLGEAWLPPWELCQPVAEAHGDLIVAWDEENRRKLGLASSEGQEAWRVDHIEYLAVGVEPATWFERKGYGGCTPLGTLLESGKVKPPPRTESPPVAEEPS